MATIELAVDTSKISKTTIDDVKLAIERLSKASEDQFQEIKKETWYIRLWDMVTFSKKNEIRLAEQISTLAQAQEALGNILIDGSDNGPAWKRYKVIKECFSAYDRAIEAAKQAGEVEIQKELELALDELKEEARFTTLSALSQEVLCKRIRAFLIAEKVFGRCVETLDLKEQEKMLKQMVPKNVTISINDIIGIYSPSIKDVITNSFSGILFTKDACYINWRTKEPICIPYALITSVPDPSKGPGLKLPITLTGKGDKKHSTITIDGLSMATQEIKDLFSDIVKIYKG